jgi:hypothetical protein
LAVIFFLSVIRWTQNRPCLFIRAMCRNPRLCRRLIWGVRDYIGEG